MRECENHEVIILGTFLVLAFSGLRFSDMQRTCTKSLHWSGSVLRGTCWRTKTSRTGQPFGLIAKGFLSMSLFKFLVTLDQILAEHGTGSEDFLIPGCERHGIRLPIQPMSYAEALFFVRHYLRLPWRTTTVSLGGDVRSFTVHGLKSTLLSWGRLHRHMPHWSMQCSENFVIAFIPLRNCRRILLFGCGRRNGCWWVRLTWTRCINEFKKVSGFYWYRWFQMKLKVLPCIGEVHVWQTVETGRLVLPLDADHPVPMEWTAWIYSELQKQCSLETVKRHEHHPYYTSVLMPVEPYVFPAISSVPRANLAVANRLIGGTIYKAYFFRELNINCHFRNRLIGGTYHI